MLPWEQSFRVEQTIQSPVNAVLYDLFFNGSVEVGGRQIYLERPSLPKPIRESDHIRWVFRSPIKVSTPGPDSSIHEIKQYRDRIEISIWPWADVRIQVEQ